MSNKLLHELTVVLRDLTEITAAIHRERVVLAQSDLESAEGNFQKWQAEERMKALVIAPRKNSSLLPQSSSPGTGDG